MFVILDASLVYKLSDSQSTGLVKRFEIGATYCRDFTTDKGFCWFSRVLIAPCSNPFNFQRLAKQLSNNPVTSNPKNFTSLDCHVDNTKYEGPCHSCFLYSAIDS